MFYDTNRRGNFLDSSHSWKIEGGVNFKRRYPSECKNNKKVIRERERSILSTRQTVRKDNFSRC